MRSNPRQGAWFRASLMMVLIFVFGTVVQGQDRHDWRSLAQLRVGDYIRLSLTTGLVEGAFQNFTPQRVTVGRVTANRAEVLKIERYRPGAWGRKKKATVGAAIGLGAGFVLGAAAGDCKSPNCYGRAANGMFVGATFALIGAGIGALLPQHTKDLIYSVG